ncbi:MAG: nitroreductase family protein, partial [Acidimicrobiales bacterium]
MTELLDLSPDELLTTTRAVRRRMDFERPVSLELVRECIEVAVQAPSGSNAQGWHFVVVTDAAKRNALADLYRKAFEIYARMPGSAGAASTGDPSHDATQQRVRSSAAYLAENMHRPPVLVIACIEQRIDGDQLLSSASVLGSILPAAWSFCLAARARGLGTSWTTLHLMFESEAAEVLGVPHDEVSQVALLPVAHTLGTGFKRAPRGPLDEV